MQHIFTEQKSENPASTEITDYLKTVQPYLHDGNLKLQIDKHNPNWGKLTYLEKRTFLLSNHTAEFLLSIRDARTNSTSGKRAYKRCGIVDIKNAD